MATHSGTLAWRIPWTEDPGGLPSMGSRRVGHDWSDLAAAALYWFCHTLTWICHGRTRVPHPEPLKSLHPYDGLWGPSPLPLTLTSLALIPVLAQPHQTHWTPCYLSNCQTGCAPGPSHWLFSLPGMLKDPLPRFLTSLEFLLRHSQEANCSFLSCL